MYDLDKPQLLRFISSDLLGTNSVQVSVPTPHCADSDTHAPVSPTDGTGAQRRRRRRRRHRPGTLEAQSLPAKVGRWSLPPSSIEWGLFQSTTMTSTASRGPDQSLFSCPTVQFSHTPARPHFPLRIAHCQPFGVNPPPWSRGRARLPSPSPAAPLASIQARISLTDFAISPGWRKLLL